MVKNEDIKKAVEKCHHNHNDEILERKITYCTQHFKYNRRPSLKEKICSGDRLRKVCIKYGIMSDFCN